MTYSIAVLVHTLAYAILVLLCCFFSYRIKMTSETGELPEKMSKKLSNIGKLVQFITRTIGHGLTVALNAWQFV